MEGFKAHPLYPQLCSKVRVFKDELRGRYVEAVEDIPPGEIVCFEKGTIVSIDQGKCMYCLDKVEKERNCCLTCETTVKPLISPYEDPFSKELNELGIAKLAIRILLTYSTENIVRCAKGNSSWQPGGALCTSDFLSVMCLQKLGDSLDLSVIDPFLNKFAAILEKHPGWSSVPFSLFRKVFRAVCLRLTINAHTIFSVEKLLKNSNLDELVPCGTGLFPIACLINHSCRANVFSFFHKNTFIFVSKGIRKGDEIVDNYGTQSTNASFAHRKEFLMGRSFECICEICKDPNTRSLDALLVLPYGYKPPSSFSLKRYEKMKSRQLLADGHIEYERLLNTLMEGTDLALSERSYCLNEVLRVQRKRGIFLEPEQLPIFLRMLTCVEMEKSKLIALRGCARSALLRIELFYAQLHPAYEVVSKMLDCLKRCIIVTGEVPADCQSELMTLAGELRVILGTD